MRLFLAAALTLAIIRPVQAQESGSGAEFSVTAGVDYSSGDYGTSQNTNILVLPLSAGLKAGAWHFTAILPWLHIDGAGSIVSGGSGGPIIVDPNAARVSRSGIGDLSLGVTFSALVEEKAGFNLDLGARVKMPTASSSKGLGTGKVDVSISADLSKTLGLVIPFVTIGYRIPGDPAALDLKNGFSGSIGTSVLVGKTIAIFSYDYRQSPSVLARDSHELFGALSGALTARLNWTLYGSAGLSNGSPDVAGGLMLRAKL